MILSYHDNETTKAEHVMLAMFHRESDEGDLGMERNRSELLRDDIEGVHKWLDERGALRNGVGDRLSIVGRIMRLLKAKHQHSKQTKT